MRVMLGIVLVAALVAPAFSQLAPQNGDWPEYRHDPGGDGHSALTQINTTNVANLERAWTYHTGETGRSFEDTPIFVDNVLYVLTQNQNLVALNPETGKEIWKYDIDVKVKGHEGRGVAYWPGDNQTPPRILFGTEDGRLIAVDAKTGKPSAGFGDNGSIDLRAGVADGFPKAMYGVSSPPVVYHDLVIVGPAVQETPARGPSGDPRAFDVRTGKPVWRFHAIPQPGELNGETWTDEARKDRSGTNVWGVMTLDTQRGLLFIPIGSSTYDFYGGDRPGNDLYASSVVALDALTGKMRWYYQVTHHDIWDYDMSAPPVLVDVKRNGETIPAVAQITKQGLLFILDRRTGKPVFGVEERPVPKGDVPGEWYSPTEPFPVKPLPLSKMNMTKDDVSDRSPAAAKFCGDWFSQLRNQGPFTPYGLTASVLMPGNMGGGDWGGVSFDSNLGYIFANTNNLGMMGQMAAEPAGAPMPYRNVHGYTRFLDQDGFPCNRPPWGYLTAINANTGDIVWQTVLGSYDELEAQGLKNTGAISMGGSIVTDGGLVFIAATTDSKFRAFDSHTGKELWVTKLDATGMTVPMTYMGSDGKQYVVVSAGGTNRLGAVARTAGKTSDALIAFALPAKQETSSSLKADPSPASPSQPAAAATVAASTPADSAASTPGMGSLPDGPGKATVIAVCTTCHGASNFTTIGMSRAGWEGEIETMKGNGAVGTDEQFKQILDYLAKNFPSR